MTRQPRRAWPTAWSGSTTDADWTPDWDYNRDDKTNIFRPWGYQPGHLTEWAKLLLILERQRAARWLLPRGARAVRRRACEHAWDAQHGGLFYGFAPDERIRTLPSATATSTSGSRPKASPPRRCWPRAPAKAATGTGTTGCGTTAGATSSTTSTAPGTASSTADNRKFSDEKSPAGKTDYHTMGACYEVLTALAL